MTKVFDFNHPSFQEHLPDLREYLIKNHNKPITEDEFVSFWTQRTRVKADGERILHASKKRSKSNARQQYKRLLEFGLFNENHK